MKIELCKAYNRQECQFTRNTCTLCGDGGYPGELCKECKVKRNLLVCDTCGFSWYVIKGNQFVCPNINNHENNKII